MSKQLLLLNKQRKVDDLNDHDETKTEVRYKNTPAHTDSHHRTVKDNEMKIFEIITLIFNVTSIHLNFKLNAI